jgi:hypothetical protein
MNKLRSLILAGAAVVAVAVLLAPGVVAQAPPTLTLEVKPPTGQVKPEIESPAMSVKVTYNTANQVQPLGSAQNSNVVITFTPNCANGITITGPQTMVINIPATQASTTSFSNTANFQVTVPRTAPGLQASACTIKARASALAQAAVPEVPDTPQNFVINVDYYSLNQVKLASKLKQSGPQKQVPFEMEITNFGNARTQYTFELGAEPSGKWNALLPEVLLLDSPNSGLGSPTNTAVFTVATPFKNGWNNEEGSYQIIVKPSAADDPSKVGNPLTANMLVRVRGVYVPGLEPAIMLGALLGSALILRLRKEE